MTSGLVGIMPAEPYDIHEAHAALLAWHQECVDDVPCMPWANDSSQLFQLMTADVLRYAHWLSHHYAPFIDTAELSVRAVQDGMTARYE